MSHPGALATLLLALTEAHALAENLGHPAAAPLAELAARLRDGGDQPETDRIALVIGAWFALAADARRHGYQLTRPRLAAVPEPRTARDEHEEAPT